MNIFDPWYRQNKIDKIYYHWNRNKPFIFHQIDKQTYEDMLNFHIISDTHIFHKRIQEYCNRPEGWQDLIMKEWNKVIKEDDIVLHLGDFFLIKKFEVADRKRVAKSLVDSLNGTVYLIPGNHDRHGNQWYNSVGVYKQWKELSFQLPWQYGNKRLVFSHRPVQLDRIQSDKGLQNIINIHGHQHHKGPGKTYGKEQGKIYKMGPATFVNMSVECTNYRPVRLLNILQNVRNFS